MPCHLRTHHHRYRHPHREGQFAIQPTFGLSFTTNNFSPSWRRISAGGDFQSFGMSWKFTYGLFNNLEVYAVIPYIHNWAGNVNEPGPNGERVADFGGLGDIGLTFKYRLVEEGPVAPTVSALFTPTFPAATFAISIPAGWAPTKSAAAPMPSPLGSMSPST